MNNEEHVSALDTAVIEHEGYGYERIGLVRTSAHEYAQRRRDTIATTATPTPLVAAMAICGGVGAFLATVAACVFLWVLVNYPAPSSGLFLPDTPTTDSATTMSAVGGALFALAFIPGAVVLRRDSRRMNRIEALKDEFGYTEVVIRSADYADPLDTRGASLNAVADKIAPDTRDRFLDLIEDEQEGIVEEALRVLLNEERAERKEARRRREVAERDALKAEALEALGRTGASA